MTLTLVQYRRGMGMPNLSPFCMKAEILLKLSGQPFDIEWMDDPRKAPKAKLPIIRDGNTVIADSTFIQKHLETRYAANFYPNCAETDKAIGHALSRMCEERLYWALLYSRWIEEENWPKIKAFWFGSMPPIVRSIVPILAIKQVKGNLKAHGIGRHTAEDIYALAKDDIDAVAALLGGNDFILGNTPTGADAVVYPFIANALLKALPSPILDHASSHPALISYADRCRQLWFADVDIPD